MSQSINTQPANTTRRTLVRGAAWSMPIIAVGAQAAHAGASQCAVGESYTLGPLTSQRIRAVCSDRSQWTVVTDAQAINVNYGTAYLPAWLEICNCQQDPAWYRWREVDTRSNFQIEVDGAHSDQNSSTQGFRAPFYLQSFGDEGGCRRFNLTYRASAQIPTGPTSLSDYGIRWTLQRSASQNPPWTDVRVFDLNTVRPGGWVRRNENMGNIKFWSCSKQGPNALTTATPNSPESVEEGAVDPGVTTNGD